MNDKEDYNILNDFIDALNDLVFVFNNEGTLLRVNKKACHVLGYDESEMKGRKIFELISYENREDVLKKFEKIRLGESLSCSVLFDKRNKGVVPVQSKVTQGRWNGQEVVICVSKDFSDIVFSKDKFVKAFNSSPTVSVICSIPESKILDVNYKFIREFGFTPEKVYGKKLTHINWFKEPENWNKILDSIEKDEILTETEIKLQDSEGNIKYYIFSADIIEIDNEKCVLLVGNDISRRKKIEQDLIRSEKKYRRFAELLPEMVCETDENGIVTFANKYAFEKFAFTDEDFCSGIHILELIAPEERHKAEQNLNKRLKGILNTPIEYLAISKNGKKFPVLVYIDVVREKDIFTGLRGVMIDITQRKNAEHKILRNLKQQELFSRLLLLLNTLEDINFIIDDVLKTLSEYSGVDRVFSVIFNRNGKKEGKKFHVYHGKGNKGNFLNLDEHIDEIQQTLEGQKYIYLDNDSLLPGKFNKMFGKGKVELFSVYPIFIYGNLFGLFGFEHHQPNIKWDTHDIDTYQKISGLLSNAYERKFMEQSLLEKEITNRAIINSIPDLIMHVDKDGIILDHNNIKNEDFQIQIDGYGLESINKIFPSDIAEKITFAIERAIKLEEYHIEYQIQKNNIRNSYEARIVKVNTTQVIIMIRNVSRRKQYEKDLKTAKEKAEMAYEVKSEFLANMSHEIRTPLNAILGFSEVLLEKLNNTPYQSPVQAIHSSGKTLLSLINDILDLSKIESGKMEIIYEPVGLRTMFEEIKQIFALKITEKNLNLDIILEDRVPETLMLDEIRIRQILFNLVGNSIKFTEAGTVKLYANYARYAYKNKGDLYFEVSDTGIGIPRSQQKLIFDAFRQQSQQNSKKYGGTGLGLAITKKLVEKMNGTITLHSRIWKGTTLKIFLPGVEISTSGVLPANQLHEHTNIVFEPACILIVDDMEYNIEAVKNLLSGSSLRFLSCNDGKDVLNILRKNDVDLILLDIRMPGIDGFRIIEEIRKNSIFKNITVVAFTTSSIDKTDNKWKKFDGFLQKPVSKSQIYRELKMHLKYKVLEIDGPEESDNNDFSVIPDIDQKRLNELYAILHEKYETSWKNLKEDLLVYEIEKFAVEIIKVGEKMGFNFIKSYGEHLKSYIESFDIEKMEKLLKKFPLIMDNIKYKLNAKKILTK